MFKIKYLSFAAGALASALAFAQGAVQVPPVAPVAPRAEAVPPPRAAHAPLKPCSTVTLDPPTQVVLGKSTVIRLTTPAQRMVVGGRPSGRAGAPLDALPGRPGAPGQAAAQAARQSQDGVAEVDVMLLSPTELFFIGRRAGSMNVVLQGADDTCLVKDLIVTVDPGTLQSKLKELIPGETGIKVSGAESSIVLDGIVSDATKVDQAMRLASAFADDKKIVNMLRVASPQQVMLEVSIAEVSKTLLDKLGSSVGYTRSFGNTTYSLLTNFLSEGGGLLRALRIGRAVVDVDGQKDDGLIRILAEPNVMAISGQKASFLSGGKIFIPVARSNVATGTATITLEEKEFGIGVQFTPTVLGGNRINLKLVSEVSDLVQSGNPFVTLNGVVTVLPSFTVRRADTTVELNDGQSFVIAGLIKNNVTETVKRFPGLGEVPVLGALFRSTEFQTGQTELLFVITPRLVKPLSEPPRLPTDNHIPPNRGEVYMNGALESATPAPDAPTAPREGFAPAPTTR